MRSTVFIEMSLRGVAKLVGIGLGTLLILVVVAVFSPVVAVLALVGLIMLILAVRKAVRS